MAWTEISTLDTPSAGSFVFTSLSLGSVRLLKIEMAGIHVTTDGTDLRCTFYVAGVEITTLSYQWQVDPGSSSGSTDPDENASSAAILLTQNNANWDVGNASAESFGGYILVPRPGASGPYKRTMSRCSAIGPTSNIINSQGTGVLMNTAAIDGVKIAGTSNLTAGYVRLQTI